MEAINKLSSGVAQPKKLLVTPDMKITDIVQKYPGTAFVMMEYGLHCVGCGASEIDTLESGAIGHGMAKEQFEILLADVNEEAEREEREGTPLPAD